MSNNINSYLIALLKKNTNYFYFFILQCESDKFIDYLIIINFNL